MTNTRRYPWSELPQTETEESYHLNKIIWPRLQSQMVHPCQKPALSIVRAVDAVMNLVIRNDKTKICIASNNHTFTTDVFRVLPASFALTMLKSVLTLDISSFDSVVSFSDNGRPFLDADNPVLYRSNAVFFHGMADLPSKFRTWNTPVFSKILASWANPKKIIVFSFLFNGDWHAKYSAQIENNLFSTFGKPLTDTIMEDLHTLIIDKKPKRHSNITKLEN